MGPQRGSAPCVVELYPVGRDKRPTPHITNERGVMDKGNLEACNAIGKSIANGFVTEVSTLLLFVLIAILVFNLARWAFGFGTDDSDKDGSLSGRSGMSVKTDHKTGVQYLSDGKGGMCVRVDENGKPVVTNKK